jgi:hypothetical protein
MKSASLILAMTFLGLSAMAQQTQMVVKTHETCQDSTGIKAYADGYSSQLTVNGSCPTEGVILSMTTDEAHKMNFDSNKPEKKIQIGYDEKTGTILRIYF